MEHFKGYNMKNSTVLICFFCFIIQFLNGQETAIVNNKRPFILGETIEIESKTLA